MEHGRTTTRPDATMNGKLSPSVKEEEEEMIVPRSGVYSTIECLGTDDGMICSAGSCFLLVLGEKECVCSSPPTYQRIKGRHRKRYVEMQRTESSSPAVVDCNFIK